jgi:ABC-type microcin C transport system duplicated ATPase subunit YejF
MPRRDIAINAVLLIYHYLTIVYQMNKKFSVLRDGRVDWRKGRRKQLLDISSNPSKHSPNGMTCRLIN